MEMFNILNRQQQPFIQSGYGAMGKLNTLLGLNPRPNVANAPMGGPAMGAPPQMDMSGLGPMEKMFMQARMRQQGQAGDNAYMPTAGGGVQPIMTNGPRMYAGGPGGDPYMPGGGRLPLSRILALRAAHGDTQAGSVLNRMQQ